MFTKITKNLNIHQSLSDAPNTDDGLSAAQLKAKFDEPVNDVKDAYNTLVEQMTYKSASDNIGCQDLYENDGSGQTLTNKLQYIYEQLENITIGSVPDNSITEAKIDSTYKSTLATQTNINAVNTSINTLRSDMTSGTYKKVLYYKVPSFTNAVEKTVQLSTGHVYRLMIWKKTTNSTGSSSYDYTTLTWNGTSIKPYASRADTNYSCDIYVNDETIVASKSLENAGGYTPNIAEMVKRFDNAENVTIRWTAGNTQSASNGIEAGSVIMIYEL